MKKNWIITASALIIIGFIGLLISNFDITDKKLIPFEREFEFSEELTIEDITVLASSSNINFTVEPSRDNRSFVTIEGEAELSTIEKIKQSQLVDGEFIVDIVENETFRLLSFGFQETEITITAALPSEKPINKLKLNMKSGNARVENVMATLGEIDVLSGKVEVTNSVLDLLSVSAKSGNINIFEHRGKLLVDILSGNVTIDQLTGNSKVDSTSGKIKLVQHDNLGATINAKSGNVEVVQYQASDAHIEVFSGDVKLEVAEDFAGYFDLKATSGKITAPESLRENQQLVKIRTTSGNIKINTISNE